MGLLLQGKGPTWTKLGWDDTHLKKASNKDLVEEGKASVSFSKVEDGRR